MKALLICPSPRPAISQLSAALPLAAAPLLGKCLVEYWIEHLVALGVREIAIAASDRSAAIAAVVGDGTRWGVPVAVTPEKRELSRVEAWARPSPPPATGPDIIEVMDHLPGQPELPLFDSYAGWFGALQSWMPRAQALERIGQCEVQPGVWLGLRTRVDAAASLIAPCWLGDHVSVGTGAVIGPGAILEDDVVVAEGARVAQSVIGPATFVGAQAWVENSLAHRDTLVNWTTNSCLRVPDAFWLGSLREPLAASRCGSWPRPMKISHDGRRMSVTELTELSTANAVAFREVVRLAWSTSFSVIDIDLAWTRFLDSCGLGILCELQRLAAARGTVLRLLNPDPAICQLLELTQVRQFFEIGETESAARTRPVPVDRSALRAFASAG